MGTPLAHRPTREANSKLSSSQVNGPWRKKPPPGWKTHFHPVFRRFRDLYRNLFALPHRDEATRKDGGKLTAMGPTPPTRVGLNRKRLERPGQAIRSGPVQRERTSAATKPATPSPTNIVDQSRSTCIESACSSLPPVPDGPRYKNWGHPRGTPADAGDHPAAVADTFALPVSLAPIFCVRQYMRLSPLTTAIARWVGLGLL